MLRPAYLQPSPSLMLEAACICMAYKAMEWRAMAAEGAQARVYVQYLSGIKSLHLARPALA